MKCSKQVKGYVTSPFTPAAGEEVQHWIWLLRTFSDRCCVTHLNARLLYVVSLAISGEFLGNAAHVLHRSALLCQLCPLYCAACHDETAEACCTAAS